MTQQPDAASLWGEPVRVLVCIGYNPSSQLLIRRAAQLARALGGQLYAAHIQTSGSLAPGYRTTLEQNMAQARNLGATILIERGDDVAETISRLARQEHITHVVMGESARSRIREIQSGSLVRQILQATSGVDLYIVADRA